MKFIRDNILMVYSLEVTCEPGFSETVPFVLSEFNFTGAEYSDDTVRLFFYSAKEREEAKSYLVNNFASIISSFTLGSLQDKNWNEIWESNFEPIDIPPDIHIRAEFHPSSNVKHELVIKPEMAFGTGHHATTYLMGSQMRTLDLIKKKVFDFGCGTGILSILASKLGAKSVLAVDIETEAIESTVRNCKINHVNNISVLKGSIDVVKGGSFDIILANINRNVLLETTNNIHQLSHPSTIVLLSGILEGDLDMIKKAYGKYWNNYQVVERGGWLCVKFQNLTSSS